MNPFDLWDQATITSMVRESTDLLLANQERVAPQFAQLEQTRLRKIAKGRIKLKAVGKGRGVLADDATPPVYRPELRFTEEAFTHDAPRGDDDRRGVSPRSARAQRHRRRVGRPARSGWGGHHHPRAGRRVRQENLSDWLSCRRFSTAARCEGRQPAGQDQAMTTSSSTTSTRQGRSHRPRPRSTRRVPSRSTSSAPPSSRRRTRRAATARSSPCRRSC
jgi:hypothetical protein